MPWLERGHIATFCLSWVQTGQLLLVGCRGKRPCIGVRATTTSISLAGLEKKAFINFILGLVQSITP